MNDISDLEGRITAALDRIRRGVDALEAQAVGQGEPGLDPAALQAQLEEERLANAQLEERVRALKDRQENRIAGLEAQVGEARGRLSGLESELDSLRQANAELRDITAQLRASLVDGVAEPELVNRALMAELDALRATRAAELAEVNEILAELKPIVEEGR